MLYGSGTGGETLHVHSSDGSTLREMMSWLLSWTCDVVSKIILCQ